MSYKFVYNPFTKKMDYVLSSDSGSWASSTKIERI